MKLLTGAARGKTAERIAAAGKIRIRKAAGIASGAKLIVLPAFVFVA